MSMLLKIKRESNSLNTIIFIHKRILIYILLFIIILGLNTDTYANYREKDVIAKQNYELYFTNIEKLPLISYYGDSDPDDLYSIKKLIKSVIDELIGIYIFYIPKFTDIGAVDLENDKFIKRMKEEYNNILKMKNIDEIAETIFEKTELSSLYYEKIKIEDRSCFLRKHIKYVSDLLDYFISQSIKCIDENCNKRGKILYKILNGDLYGNKPGELRGYRVYTAGGVRILLLELNEWTLKWLIDRLISEIEPVEKYNDIANIETLRYNYVIKLRDFKRFRDNLDKAVKKDYDISKLADIKSEYINIEKERERFYKDVMRIFESTYDKESDFYKKVKESPISKNDDALFALLSICELKILYKLKNYAYYNDTMKLAEEHFLKVFHPGTRTIFESNLRRDGLDEKLMPIILNSKIPLVFANYKIYRKCYFTLDLISYIYRKRRVEAIKPVISYIFSSYKEKLHIRSDDFPITNIAAMTDIGGPDWSTFLTGVFDPDNENIREYVDGPHQSFWPYHIYKDKSPYIIGQFSTIGLRIGLDISNFIIDSPNSHKDYYDKFIYRLFIPENETFEKSIDKLSVEYLKQDLYIKKLKNIEFGPVTYGIVCSVSERVKYNIPSLKYQIKIIEDSLYKYYHKYNLFNYIYKEPYFYLFIPVINNN